MSREKIDHEMLKSFGTLIGFELNKEGICQGISYMAASCCITGNLNYFNDTIDAIAKVCKDMADISEQDGFDELTTDEQSEKLESCVPENQQKTIMQFYEYVNKYQELQSEPELFTDLFGTEIQEQASLCLAVSEKELTELLQKILSEIFSTIDKPMSFVIGGAFSNGKGYHAITVTYDPTTKTWGLIDANKLPSITSSDASAISKEIMGVYARNNNALLYVRPCTLKNESDEIKLKFKSLQQEILNKTKQSKLSIRDAKENSPLDIAVQNNSLAWTKKFLALGGEPNNKNHDNDILLLYAINRQQSGIVDALLKHNANKDVLSVNKLPPLHEAVMNEDIQTTEVLLKHGCDPNEQNQSGYSALHLAVQLHNLELSKILIEYDSDLALKTTQESKDSLELGPAQELADELVKAKDAATASRENNIQYSAAHGRFFQPKAPAPKTDEQQEKSSDKSDTKPNAKR